MGLMPRRVVKLGGSSLSKTDYADRLRCWLAGQPAAQSIVVVGGGASVEKIAARQRREEYDDARAHWECIDLMRRNAERLLLQSPEFVRLTTLEELPTGNGQAIVYVLDPRRFMEADARCVAPLPESWDVSSDSIAARAAEVCRADELVLLKSKLPKRMNPLGDYVDSYFPTAAKNVPAVRFVNLRDDQFAAVVWR